ncbi:MAG: hypothetical protein KGL65_08590 [Rhodospirillales bacterium]|nr:hypothetical protein [Rhodospirillales bacterium]MDE2391651.1 hypothetical protein [Rhodospirillales bacterium]
MAAPGAEADVSCGTDSKQRRIIAPKPLKIHVAEKAKAQPTGAINKSNNQMKSSHPTQRFLKQSAENGWPAAQSVK